MRVLRGSVIGVLVCIVAACGGEKKKGDGGETPTPTPTSTPAGDVQIHAGAPGGPVAPLLFGANSQWLGLGSGIVTEGADLLADRSFRTEAWSQVPGTGVVLFTTSAGDPTPANFAPAYDGDARFAGAGSPFVFQPLLGPVLGGNAYSLSLSSYGDGSTPTLFAGLVQGTAFTAIATTQFDTTMLGEWKHHLMTITPTVDSDGAILTLGMIGPGALRIDEVRLVMAGTEPIVDPIVADRIGTLGVQALRWPGGTLVDVFDWKTSIGPRALRGEALGDFGRLETPSFGLDEFLQLCEDQGLTPLLQVNVLESPAKAAELVEYVNGPVGSTWGNVRAANGHAAPYGVVHWELGNEPSFAYQGGGAEGDTGGTYAALAAATADAMLAEDPTIELSAALETSFQLASYLPAVPILANWNAQVAANAGLVADLSFVHGHFYGPFTDAPMDELLPLLLASGSAIRETAGGLPTAVSTQPFWLTEYGVSVTTTSGAILPQHLSDFVSGLVTADVLLEMADADAAAAFAFDLAQPVGYGMLVHPGAWDFRPSGLAFQTVAPIAGEARRPVTVTGGSTVSIDDAESNLPAMTYDELAVVVTQTVAGRPRLLILNRSVDQDHDVSVSFEDGTWMTGTATRLESDDLDANNESNGANITLTTEAVDLAVTPLHVPAHSLVRVDFD